MAGKAVLEARGDDVRVFVRRQHPFGYSQAEIWNDAEVRVAYRRADVVVVHNEPIILDSIGSESSLTHLFIVLGDDNKSVRAFERTVDGRKLEFFVKPDTKPIQLTDAETATTWDFTGRAVSGPLAGKQLKKIFVLKDYWFDWKIYNPTTKVYTLGESPSQSRK